MCWSAIGFSNLPLRGDKEYLYEGGVKTVGFITGGAIRKPGRVEKGYVITLSHSFLYVIHFMHVKASVAQMYLLCIIN